MSETAAVAYNPFDPAFAEDPYQQYEALRDADPVHQSPFGIWLLFRYEDVLRFLRDPSLSVEDANAKPTVFDQMIDEVMGDRDREQGTRAMLNRDPPDHTRLRKLVSKAFTPRTIEQLRPRVQQIVDDSLDRAAEAGQMELMRDYAFQLPFTVISEMLGMPPTVDTDKLREWSGTLVRTLEPVIDPAVLHQIADAGEHMRELILDVIAWKRANPADDMLTALIQAEEHGDVLSDEELLEQLMLIYIAGHETTVNLIGNGTLALLRDRDQLARLREDPSLDANAVEELLRFDPPVQMTRRITLKDVEVGGKTIEEGVFVVCGLASSNRDESHFGPTAGSVDLGRGNAKEHLAFGGGAHYCLGAALARLEGQVAIGSLVRRFSTIEPTAEPVWNGRINLRGMDRLPLTVKE